MFSLGRGVDTPEESDGPNAVVFAVFERELWAEIELCANVFASEFLRCLWWGVVSVFSELYIICVFYIRRM